MDEINTTNPSLNIKLHQWEFCQSVSKIRFLKLVDEITQRHSVWSSRRDGNSCDTVSCILGVANTIFLTNLT